MRLTLAAAAIGLAFSAPALADSATINQTGVDNYAAVEQQNADGSSARITQVGDRNHAGAAASGDAAATQGIRQVNASFSSAQIDQRGNDNEASIHQQDVFNVYWSRIVQGEAFGSNGNFASIEQSALRNSFAEVFQDRASGNSGAITQTGDSQFGQIVQGAYRWNNGWVFTGTAANNNTAGVTQSGEHQSSIVNQLGDSNRANSNQSGAWNDSVIIQEGSFNFALVLQHGSGGEFGERNVARVTQAGTGHSATASQAGMGNTALINQH